MLKQFWPTTPSSATAQLPVGPADQMTPRAAPTSNPFDNPGTLQQQQQQPATSSSSSATSTTDNPSAPPSPSLASPRPLHVNTSNISGLSSAAGGLRTPTTNEYGQQAIPLTPPPVLGTPGASRPMTGITVGDTMSGNGGLGFGLREPPKMRRALTKDSSKSNLSAASLTLETNPSSLSSDPSAPSTASSISGNGSSTQQQHNPERAPRGTLTIKLIAARNLAVSSTSGQRPEPYAVIQFEQNEFVSRAPLPSSPHTAHAPFQTSVPKPAIPRNNSYGPSLGLGSISRAFADAARRTKPKGSHPTQSGTVTPKNEPESQMMADVLGSNSPSNPVWKEEAAFDLTSFNSIIYVSVYDRSKAAEGFLGVREIRPVVRDGMTVDNWFELQPRGGEHVTGEIWLQISYDALKSKQHLTPKDFDIMKLIGKGTFGKVFQVRKRDTKRIYAMKMLSKKDIVAKKEIAHTIGERKILQRSLECPFLVGLKFSFQTEEYLFFVTDYKSGGELFWHLQKEGRFTEPRAKFYIAELVLALEHLHKYHIVYRDLKPENILLDATGHIALCDFGLSKPDLGNGQLTNTFCGTTEYLAPEVLLDDHGYSKLVDFWSLGVLLFEMCCGWSPFYSEDVQQMYKNICFGKIRFPRGVIGEDGKQFVKQLLNRNPKHRLGAERDAAELKEHPFFKDIDWTALAAKQITPPFKPLVESDESVANFDPLFTSSDLRDVPFDWNIAGESNDDPMPTGHSYNGPGGGMSVDRNGKSASGTPGTASSMAIKPVRPPAHPVGSPLTSSVQENFRGFTYTGESVLPTSVGGLHIDDGEEYSSDEEAVEEYDEDETMEDENGDGWRTRRPSDNVEMES